MKKNFDIRLAALREYLKSLSADETTFVVEGGGEYHTKEDPFKKKSPKLVDWEQDYPLILPPINRIFGRDIRGIPYDAETNTGGVHWWTFLGAYNNLGDCTFAQVVRIRDKKARGKTLEKDEREWYRRNSDLVNIKNKLSQEEETTISTWLKLGKE